MTLDAGWHDFNMARQVAELQRELAARRQEHISAGIVATADGGVAFSEAIAAECESPTFVGSAAQRSSGTIPLAWPTTP